jgi:transposase-like protein
MHRRKWDAPINAKMVSQGLQGKPIAEICHEHQISPSQYDQGRDQFLAHAANAFEVNQHNRTEARLAKENTRLKTLVGELTVE